MLLLSFFVVHSLLYYCVLLLLLSSFSRMISSSAYSVPPFLSNLALVFPSQPAPPTAHLVPVQLSLIPSMAHVLKTTGND